MTLKYASDKINPIGKKLNPNSGVIKMTNKWKKNYPNLAKAINDRGLKITHVAKSAGLTYRQLYGRLTNEIDFELPVMRKLASIFDDNMDRLFNDKKIS